MELEVIYSKINYENARYNMDLTRIKCLKAEADLLHLKNLEQLNQEKEKIISAMVKLDKVYSYKPIKFTTDIRL